jgi:outer membrane protein TolC
MNRLITVLIILSAAVATRAQQSVTLWQCYDSAAVVTPLAGERDIYTRISVLRDQNLASAWLPSLDLNGNFSYQSDVVDMSDMLGSLPVSPSLLPTIPHEQYRATVDVNQVIWDGGVTHSAREVEKVVNELNLTQNEADIYRLREQVNNYFFPLLQTRSQTEVVQLMIDELATRIGEVTSGIENGVVTPVTLDVLKAEMIRAEQSLFELDRRSEALAAALEQITGIKGIRDAVLLLPETAVTGEETIDNPDLRLFDVRSRQLEVSKSLLRSQRMPKAFGFAQAGYGSPPGNNFLSENPDFYYSLGAGIRWNIFDWNRNSNERKLLTLQQELIDIKKEAAVETLRRLLTVRMAEITALREASVRDEELIGIHKRVTAAAVSQLNNGTITASQYLTELNNEKQAVIAAAARKISIARAQTDYKYLTGFDR